MTEDAPASNGRARGLLVLALWLVAVAATTTYATGWPTDNRVSRWVGQLGEDEGWELLVERFGGDEVVLVRVIGVDLSSEEARRQLGHTARGFNGEPAVLQCADAMTLYPSLVLKAVLGSAGRQRDLPKDPLVRALDLIDPEGSRYDFLLAIDAEATPADRAHLVETIETLREQSAVLGWEVLAAGHPLIASALDDEARAVEQTFAPLLGVLAAVGAWLFLRSLWLSVAVLLPAAFAAAAPRAALRMAGVDSDLLLVALGPMGFVLLLASVLHLVTAYARLRRRLDAGAARRAAVQEKLPAGLLAAFTTAIGFGVFAASPLSSVATLGSTVAVLVILTVPLAYLCVPPLLGSLGESTEHPRRMPAGVWDRIARASIRRRASVVTVAVAVLGGGAWAGLTLGRETNALHYFPDGTRVRDDFDAIEASGSGLSTVDVLMRRTDGPRWRAEELVELDFASRLAAVPGVTGVVGPETLAPMRELGIQPWTALSLSRRLDPQREYARWTVRFLTGEAEPTRELVEAVRSEAKAWIGDRNWTLHVTGSVPAMLAMQDELIVTLATSLALTLLVTTLCFLLLTRSARPLFAAVIANLFPAAAALLAARLLGIPLDSATVMVAAVVLGLAVDNTFHLMHAGRGGTRARLRAFEKVGHATFVSSLALALGFGALALSGFAPTARFGLLCAIGALAALVGDLVVLPALWVRPGRSTP